MSFENNPTTNPELVDPNMYGSAEIAPAQYSPDQLLQNVDALMQVAYSPTIIVEASSRGDHEEDALRLAEIEGVRREALEHIYAPTAIAREFHRTRQTIAEETGNVLRGVRNNLSETGNSYAYIDRILNDFEGQYSAVDYHLNTIDAALNDPYAQLSAEEILHGHVGQIASLDEFYHNSMHQVTVAALGIEEGITHASAITNNAAQETQSVKNRAVNYRGEVQDDPSVALVEGIEDEVVRRGAETVGEHEKGCEESADADLEAIADIRDDAQELSGELSQLVTNGQLRPTAESANVDQGYFYAVQQLRETLYHFINYGMENKYPILEAVGGVRSQLNQIKRNIDELRSAKAGDVGRVTKTVEHLDSVLASEHMVAA